jgi:hypothetical protein
MKANELADILKNVKGEWRPNLPMRGANRLNRCDKKRWQSDCINGCLMLEARKGSI